MKPMTESEFTQNLLSQTKKKITDSRSRISKICIQSKIEHSLTNYQYRNLYQKTMVDLFDFEEESDLVAMLFTKFENSRFYMEARKNTDCTEIDIKNFKPKASSIFLTGNQRLAESGKLEKNFPEDTLKLTKPLGKIDYFLGLPSDVILALPLDFFKKTSHGENEIQSTLTQAPFGYRDLDLVMEERKLYSKEEEKTLAQAHFKVTLSKGFGFEFDPNSEVFNISLKNRNAREKRMYKA